MMKTTMGVKGLRRPRGMIEVLCGLLCPLFSSGLVLLSACAGGKGRDVLHVNGDFRGVLEGHGLCTCITVARDF